MVKNLSNHIGNLILILAGIALFISAQGVQTGSAMAQGGDFMPKLLSVFWMVLSVLIFLSDLRKTQKKTGNINVKKFLATLGILFAYVFLLKPIGFTLSSIIYTFIQILLLVPEKPQSKKHYIIFALIAIILPIAINLLFVNAFSLILPQGTIFQ